MRKKLFTFLLAMATSFGIMHAEVYQGTCGSNLTWSLNTADSTLTISGTGKMEDYKTSGNTLAFPSWKSYISFVKHVIIEDGVTSIGDAAFYSESYYKSSRLISVAIPSSVTSIGANAFSGCFGLTSIIIPDNVTRIWKDAFLYVPNVEYSGTATGAPWGAQSVNGYIEEYLVYADNSKAKLLACSGIATEVTIPNSVTSIKEGAFYGCSGLKSVYISDLTAWCNINFSYYSSNPLLYNANLYLNNELVTNLVIPNNIISIENYTFYGCINLTSVTIPNNVTSIGNSAFSKCSSLTSVTIPESVTSIGSSAFQGCSSLNSVTISNSVTNIGDCAFQGCTGLSKVSIPESLQTIGMKPFNECSGLKSVVWNAVNCTTYDDGQYFYPPFQNCTNITSFVIGDSVQTLSQGLCYGLPITTIVIPEKVAKIENDAFSECDKLTSVVIPNNVTDIGEGTFYDCTSLKSIEFPKNLKTIEKWVMGYCTSLTNITLPENITSIGDYAFYNCQGLNTIDAKPIVPPTLGTDVFYIYNSGTDNNIPTSAIVYTQFGSGKIYRSAEGWKELNIQVSSVSQDITPSATSCTLIFFADSTELQSCGIEGGEQQAGNTLEYIGLEPNSEYADIPIVLTSNTGETETVNVSFTTTALELTTKPSKPVSSTTAILLAETNMSDAEVNCGFEYKRNDAPADMDGTKVFCPVASGQMADGSRISKTMSITNIARSISLRQETYTTATGSISSPATWRLSSTRFFIPTEQPL